MTSSKNTHEAPGNVDVQSVTESVKDMGTVAADLGTEAKQQVTNLTDQLRQQATSQLNAQKEQLVDGLETVALLLHQAGEHAQQQDKALIASYVDKAATQVSTLSETIGQQDLSQVVETTKDFARREPMMFVGGALLAGFLGARFLRSSPNLAEQVGEDQATATNGQLNGTGDDATDFPVVDEDPAWAAATDDVVAESDFSDESQTGTFDGNGLEDDTAAVAVTSSDREENL